MQLCRFCRTELPQDTHFCGHCGHTLTDVPEGATSLSHPMLSPAQSSSLLPLHSQVTVSQAQQPAYGTPRFEDMDTQPTPIPGHPDEEDEEEKRRRLLMELPLVGTLLDGGQTPGNIPMGHGTPQADVPMGHGTPTTSGFSPDGVAMSAPAPTATPPLSLPQNAPSWTPDANPPGLPPHPSLPPGSPPAPGSGSTSHPPPSPGASGCIPVWLMIVLVFIVIVAGIFGSFFLFVTPSLSLTGSSSVASGGTLYLHGSGFAPGVSVSLTLDRSVSLYAAGSTRQIVASAAMAPFALGGPVRAGLNGGFDVSIPIDPHWSAGRHSILAAESISTRSAELPFTIVSNTAKLAVSNSTLDFGKVQVGAIPTLSITIGNTGGQQLIWTADVGNASWVHLQKDTGAINAGAPQQNIYLIVDTTHLAVGQYSAMLHVNSNGGNAVVGVTLQVIPASGQKQAKLVVTPTSLNFGTLSPGQQANQAITISNSGTQALTWSLNTGNASWLKVDSNGGTIQVGGLPQTTTVFVDTTNLSPGNYSDTLSIASDGGSAQMSVSLVVATVAPTPTPSPTPVPAILSVSPTSLAGNSDCTYNASQGWTCGVTLSNSQSAGSSLNWTAASTGATFKPSNGTLLPGQATSVTVSVQNIVCPNTLNLIFTGPANTVTVPWSCAAPTLTVTPISMTSRNCPFKNGYYVCTVTVSDDQGGANWSVSGGIKGTIFNPQNGTVYPGSPVQVTISIPRTPCPTTMSFTFTGPGNSVTVTWKC